MVSLPGPPKTASEPPRPRISSSPFSPASPSGPSVPKSRPPLGQPGRSLVVKRAGRFTLIFLVPSHRASSLEAVAWGECVCSLCRASEPTPAQPTATRRTAHPIRKATTTAVRRPWRTTTHLPSLHVSLATKTSKHATPRSLAHLYGGLF